MPYKSMQIAKFMVDVCLKSGTPITNIKLQAAMYRVQRTFLKNGQGRAFFEDIEAWVFGPVVPNVYFMFCGFGANDIWLSYPDAEKDIERTDQNIIRKTALETAAEKPWDIQKDVCRKNGAWAETYADGFGNHRIIPTDGIAIEEKM